MPSGPVNARELEATSSLRAVSHAGDSSREVVLSPVSVARHDSLGLAVQQALPLLPLFLAPTDASPLLDGVDDADEGGEDHGRESDEGQGHGCLVRSMEFMIKSYRTR